MNGALLGSNARDARFLESDLTSLSIGTKATPPGRPRQRAHSHLRPNSLPPACHESVNVFGEFGFVVLGRGRRAVSQPSKAMPNAFRACFQRWVHLALRFPMGSRAVTARQTHLRAAYSLGKCPRALTVLRMRALTDSKLSCQAAVLRGTSRVTFASFHMCRMMTLAS